jgi:hypothetical protein
MAKGSVDRREYAIKFFVSKAGFDAEKELYLSDGAQGSNLAQFLPKVRTFIRASCIIMLTLSLLMKLRVKDAGALIRMLSLLLLDHCSNDRLRCCRCATLRITLTRNWWTLMATPCRHAL